MHIRRRRLLALSVAVGAAPALARARAGGSGAFPQGFLWGAATAAHQVEGNNLNSDVWLLENVKPTLFAERSGDACNSFELWETDLDLANSLNLNTYRFSIEWARIEPEPGRFSIAMLDHYKAIVEGCRARGLNPMVTFNHFTTPLWFAAKGGWANADAPALFARYCDAAARHLAAGVRYATTLNEPNAQQLIAVTFPEYAQRFGGVAAAMTQSAMKACGASQFSSMFAASKQDPEIVLKNMIDGHRQGRAAIKAVRPDLPVGLSLAIADDQAAGGARTRDAVRKAVYGAWLEAVKQDDFLGVQNYERHIWGATGKLPAPKKAVKNYAGAEVYPPSLAGAVRYAHQATGLPIIVTEHGVGTSDDSIRANLVPAALRELKRTMDKGVPVLGYVHWSLMDNFEWVSGYAPKFGLCAVDRETFRRTPKPSAAIYADIARRNAL